MAGLLSVFHRIYVINLKHRTDRRAEMAAELRRLGLDFDHEQVKLVPASFPDDQGEFPSRGARGCFESHLRVHQAIQADGIERALILEDDASFVPAFDTYFARLKPILEAQKWDMLYSVGSPEPISDTDAVSELLFRLRPSQDIQTSHFMGFNRASSEYALSFLQAMASRAGGDPDGGPMHVDSAYNWMRRAKPDLAVLSTRSPLAVQRASRSDIAPMKFYDHIPVLRDVAEKLRRVLR